MRINITLFLLLLISISLSCLVGCRFGRERPKDMPRLYPVRLTIIQEGVPLEEATVTLRSKIPGFRWSVSGITDSKGEVELVTNGFFPGVPEGEYKILVEKTIRIGPPNPDLREMPADELERSKIFRKIAKESKIMIVVDPQYKNEASTPLEIGITKSNNGQTFDVGKPVKIEMPMFE